MKKSSYVPPIVFTGLKIQGSQLHVALDDIKELELNPSERNVTFQFAAIDYVNPDAIEYAYRLQGLEEEWNEAGNNRSATYINLPAGEYQLQIRSSNSDGVWTDNIRTLPIHVLPTFGKHTGHGYSILSCSCYSLLSLYTFCSISTVCGIRLTWNNIYPISNYASSLIFHMNYALL